MYIIYTHILIRNLLYAHGCRFAAQASTKVFEMAQLQTEKSSQVQKIGSDLSVLCTETVGHLDIINNVMIDLSQLSEELKVEVGKFKQDDEIGIS